MLSQFSLKKNVIALAILCFSFSHLSAFNKQEYNTRNIVYTAISTVFKGFVEGNINSWKDLVEMTMIGSIAGYGFAESKNSAGNGQFSRSNALQFLSFSLIENVANGFHPLAYFHYGTGPLDLRIATPFSERKDLKFASIDLNPTQAGCFFYFYSKGYDLKFDYGIAFYESDEPIEGAQQVESDGLACGRTMAIYLDSGQFSRSEIISHELVHIQQDRQLSAIQPFSSYDIYGDGPIGLGVRIELLPFAAFEYENRNKDYFDRWSEDEALTYSDQK